MEQATTKLLITGEGRSGTTLVANFLGSQERMTILTDFLHISRLQRSYCKNSITDDILTHRKSALIDEFNEISLIRLGIKSNVKPTDFNSLVEFYRYILDEFARPEDTVIGHKTNFAIDVIHEWLELVPELKVLFVIRDPRDMVSSAIKKFPFYNWKRYPNQRTIFEFIEGWSYSYRRILELNEVLKNSLNILVIHYEDLLLKTDETLRRIGNFLGSEKIVIPDKLQFHGKKWKDNSSYGDNIKNMGFGEGILTKVLDPTPIGKWREYNPKAGRLTEILLCDAMGQAGYKISKRITGFDRLRVKSRYLFYRLVRRYRRMHQEIELRVIMKIQKKIGKM